MNENIISFTDKKREIERRIEMSLTDEELHMDYYREKLRKMEDKLNIIFICFQLSTVLFFTAILTLKIRYKDYNMVDIYVMCACFFTLLVSNKIKKYLTKRLCSLEGVRS